MGQLVLKLLGPPQVVADEEPITAFRSDKARVLLVYLAIEADTPHSREALAGLLWPDIAEPSARNNLRLSLHRLRQAIGDTGRQSGYFHITRNTLQLKRSADVWIDVRTFTELVSATKKHRCHRRQFCEECLDWRREAAELFRGEFLQGFFMDDSPALSEWMLLVQERLHRQAMEVLSDLAGHHLRRGEYGRAQSYARRQLELEPWNEEAHRQLMHALARSGRRSAALAQYETCRQVLAEELQLEPSSETSRLYERIRSAMLAPDKPLMVPYQPGRLIGREEVLMEIHQRLADPDCRLLTLVGPGGIGKTHLAVEAAKESAERGMFLEGVAFVSLASLGSADGLVHAIADALNLSLRDPADSRRQLLDYLRHKEMLLVLDNFEHLLAGVNLLNEMLDKAPEVKLLVTSRVRLPLQAAWALELEGLHYPTGEKSVRAKRYSSIELFLQSAKHVRMGHSPSEEDKDQIATICGLVQGLPLAIILAAAWVDTLTPAAIVKEIGRSLDILETDAEDLPLRHRSMRAVLEHTWRLLTEQERKAFRALSVFRGGFTRQAAMAVTGAPLNVLSQLVRQSILQFNENRGRYQVHELMRQYGAEKLSLAPEEEKATRDRHSAYYCQAVADRTDDLKGWRQLEAMAEINADLDNVRAAWQWAVEQMAVARLGQSIDALSIFYNQSARYEEAEWACCLVSDRLAGIDHTQACSPDVAAKLKLCARSLGWQSVFALTLGYNERVREQVGRGLELVDSPALAGHDTRFERAHLLWRLACVGRGEEARRQYEEAVSLFREIGDPWGTAFALYDMGASLRDYGEARRLFEESLAIHRGQRYRWGTAWMLYVIALLNGLQGRFQQADHYLRDDLAIIREMGDREGVAISQRLTASLLVWQGKFAQARPMAEQYLSTLEDVGNRSWLALSMLIAAYPDLYSGQYKAAEIQAGKGAALERELGQEGSLDVHILGAIALARRSYDEARAWFEELASATSAFEYRPVQALALLGYAYRGLEQRPLAKQYLCKATRQAAEVHDFLLLIHALPAIALLFADEGQNERAVELYALAMTQGMVANSKWFDDIAGRHLAEVAAGLPPETVEAARVRGRSLDLWRTAADLVEELSELGWEEGSAI